MTDTMQATPPRDRGADFDRIAALAKKSTDWIFQLKGGGQVRIKLPMDVRRELAGRIRGKGGEG